MQLILHKYNLNEIYFHHFYLIKKTPPEKLPTDMGVIHWHSLLYLYSLWNTDIILISFMLGLIH